MFHFTELQSVVVLAGVAMAWIVVARVLAYLKAIAFNTGRTSENVAEVLNLLRNRP
jgi:hypothetical protein